MKTNNLKFLAFLDHALLEFLSQKSQYELLSNFLKKKGLSLAFYSVETERTYLKSDNLIKKMDENPKVNGFIFFSILQISYLENNNIKVIKKLLNKNYEIIFFRENMHIKKDLDLKKNIKKIKLFRDNNLHLIKKLENLI
tara:strand:+ start:499 stop:918 length:420 start_codon:yes stop_codon:yes gene_type:complete